MRLLIAATFLITIIANAQTAVPWPEADKLFHSDPRWLGADAAFTVDLGKNRVLWLFGDTWIAHPGSHSRRDAAFLHNTVAIETGYDPSHATIKFYWKTKHKDVTEIFPNEGRVWMWLGSGIRVDNSLLIFACRVAHDNAKDSLGFKSVGWNAYLIDNPDSEPSAWKPRKIAESGVSVIMGAGFLREGNAVYIFGLGGIHNDLYIARTSAQRMAQGRLDALEWWSGHDWHGTIASRQPVLTESGTELSIQRDPTGKGFLEINSQGFGASDIIMRRAPALTGPWSTAQKIYRPPESDGPDPFVYAGKSHPELLGAGLVLTYATNNFKEENGDDLTRYFPRFVRVTSAPAP
jgi:hypothetical protein